MAEHPNIARIREGYDAFGKGDFAALNGLFADDIVWHVTGHNQLAGDYTGREAVYALFGRLMELTEGSFRNEVHAVLADDEHATVLARTSAHKGETSVEVTDAHVMHLRDGMITEFWVASTDQYALDGLLG